MSRRSIVCILLGAAVLGLLAVGGCSDPHTESVAGSPGPAGDTAARAATTADPWFEEASQARGLTFKHHSGYAERLLFPEIMGGGAALFDMDGDGDLDAYLVQSGSLVEPRTDAARNRLYLNDGRGYFRDITEGSGADDRGYGMGVAAADYDNDGDVDLYVTNFGPNALLRNDGAGRFTDVAQEAGVADPRWGASAAFVDYDRDGWLDLFVANYVNWSVEIEQDCYNNAGMLDYCLPTNYNVPASDVLYHNNGDGSFTDVTVETGIQTAFGNGLGVVTGDFDANGWIDIFVANDAMMDQLWLNEGGRHFRDESLLWGCAVDEHGVEKAGMGTVAADYDDDGDLDLMVVNISGQTDSFFRNEGSYFVDDTGAAGLATTSRRFTRFGLGLIDFDNDGTLDLYSANGRVTIPAEPLIAEDVFAEPNLLYRGDGRGGFREVDPRGGTAEELMHTSRAAAFGDVDNDGGVDVLVVNRDGPASLLINVVRERGHWVAFRVVESHGRDAIGASVTIGVEGRRVTRDVRTAYSYCASNDPRVWFGLGTATGVSDVTVRWPDGAEQRFGDFSAGSIVTLQQAE